MSGDRFDELARALTQPMPRRRAFGLIVGAVASSYLGRPPRARAGRKASCPPGTSACQSATGTACCGGTTPLCCHDKVGAWCCLRDQSCNYSGTGPNCLCPGGGVPCYSPSEARCCKPGEECHSGRCIEKPCPGGGTRCGGQCCDPGEVCSGGSCSSACPRGTTRCGIDCCSKNEQCTTIRVGPTSTRVCVPRCPQGQALCGGRCCPKNWRCANPRTGQCRRCARGQEECGRKCCPPGQFCCNPEKGTCCKKKGETCCFTGPPNKVSAICCRSGTTCAPLANAAGHLDGMPQYVCCPSSRVVPLSATELCCPPGYVSLGGKLVVPAGGGGGLCCRESDTCGSGKDITCCSSGSAVAPELRQSCCSGRCVSTMVDPRNCGRCGNTCAAGERCENGSCVPA